MAKIVKKTLPIAIRIAVGLLLIAALLLAAAVIFEKRWGSAMVQRSIKELNAHLQAPVTISSAEFTFFDNFPHASIHLRNVVVRSAHPEYFGSDTLLLARSIFLVFNPLKLLRGDYTVNACHAEQGYLTMQIAPNGTQNFDILKPSNTSDSANNVLQLNVNRFRLSQMACTFNSSKAQLNVDLFIASLAASLRLDGAHQRLSVKGEGLINLLKQKEFIYARRAPFALETIVLRDSSRYEAQKGILAIDQNYLAIEGHYDAESMNLALRASSSSLNLPSLLAFASQYKWKIPSQLRLRGDINATLALEGSLQRSSALSIGLKVNGTNLTCTYGSSKFSINRIAAEFSNGDKRNLSTASLNIASCELANDRSTAQLQLYLTNLIRPTVYAKWNVALANSDLLPAQWSKFAPRYASIRTRGEYVATFPSLDSLSLRQAIRPKLRLEADANGLEAKLNENSTLSNVSASLTIVDHNISKGMLRASINDQPIEMAFSATDILKPQSNLARWTINASFNNFDFNRISPLLPMPSKDSSSRAGNGFSLWQYAQRIDGEVTISNSLWRRAKLDSVEARFAARAGSITCRINHAAFLGGTTHGTISLTQSADTTLLISASLDEQQLDIKQLFEGFDNFQQSVLRSENLEGKLSGRITFQLPYHKKRFDINDVQAQATVAISDGALINVQPLAHLSKFIALDELMNLRFATLYNTISLRNGRISIPSMQINSSALGLTAAGEHHFNGRYLYRVKVGLGDILFNRLRARRRSVEENAIAADDDHEKMWIFLLIEGDSSSAYVHYDTEALGDYIQERVDLEKASLQEAFDETYGRPNADSARHAKRRKEKTPPILWQDEPAAPKPTAQDTTKQAARRIPTPKPTPPILWDE